MLLFDDIQLCRLRLNEGLSGMDRALQFRVWGSGGDDEEEEEEEEEKEDNTARVMYT